MWSWSCLVLRLFFLIKPNEKETFNNNKECTGYLENERVKIEADQCTVFSLDYFLLFPDIALLLFYFIPRVFFLFLRHYQSRLDFVSWKMLLPTTSMILLPFKNQEPSSSSRRIEYITSSPQATESDIQPDFNIGQLFGDFVYPFWSERERKR